MNLKSLTDSQLLTQTKRLVAEERELLTQILHHLKEVERRKLFSDLNYRSLFEYSVKELRYSESQAARRINAMRLIAEIPEVEFKIQSGSLSLTNIYQAQSYFAEVKKANPNAPVDTQDKINFLKSIENKTTRKTEAIILDLLPETSLPKEKERLITAELTEIRLVLDKKIKAKLEYVRSLMGIVGNDMRLSELIDLMATESILNLEIKKFGKSRRSSE